MGSVIWATIGLAGVSGLTYGVQRNQIKAMTPEAKGSLIGRWKILGMSQGDTSELHFAKNGSYIRTKTILRPGEKFSECTTARGTFKTSTSGVVFHMTSITLDSRNPTRKIEVQKFNAAMKNVVKVSKDLTGSITWKDSNTAELKLHPAPGRTEGPVVLTLIRQAK